MAKKLDLSKGLLLVCSKCHRRYNGINIDTMRVQAIEEKLEFTCPEAECGGGLKLYRVNPEHGIKPIEVRFELTTDGVQPIEWWEPEHFTGRTITELEIPSIADVFNPDGSLNQDLKPIGSHPIPDSHIVCDFCNELITSFPIPVFRGTHALCNECYKNITGHNGENEQTCVVCGKLAKEFRDPESEAEFRISRLCQECQDRIFIEDEPDEDEEGA